MVNITPRFAVVAALFLLTAGTAVVAIADADTEVPPPPDVGGIPDDAEVTESGLASRVLEPPEEAVEGARAQDWVIIRYHSWTTDGEVFDSSIARKQALKTPVSVLVPGLREALAMMSPGEKRRLWIPGELAYEGSEGKPQGMLVFDLELARTLRHPDTPEDVAAPPAEAEVLKNGLASKVLAAGTGTRKPNLRDTVVVHYSGWTTDGEMFDSSVLQDEPVEFPLSGVIKGWTIGVGLMVEGEKRRLWIPEKLAYRGQKGKPQGMLVFDVELIEIK